MNTIPIRRLGQAGVRLELGGKAIYIDPYLTDAVLEIEKEPDLKRLVEPPFAPRDVTDADLILVTHDHLDHCDPSTIVPMSTASPQAQIVCPDPCRSILTAAGIDDRRLITATDTLTFGDLQIHVVPAAHTAIERDESGSLRFVGYVLEHEGHRVYHAGDTCLTDEVIESVRTAGPIDVALLPVNERNYYRDKRGIIGNMTVREAFQFALDIGTKHLVPLHWDLFAPNRVYPGEIQLLYDLERPAFELHILNEKG